MIWEMTQVAGNMIRGLKLGSARVLTALIITVMIVSSVVAAGETVCYAGEEYSAADTELTGSDGGTENSTGNDQTGNSEDNGENGSGINDETGSEETSDEVIVPLKPRVKKRDRKWHYGKWKNDCYYNGSGVKLGSFQAMMKKKLPKLKKLTSSQKILVIGASRVLGMKGAVKDSKVFFYGCGGAGISWFFEKIKKDTVRQPALLVIRAFLKEQPRGKVIIDMGGNDLSNINAYIGFYRSLQRHFPKAKFYFMGILPRARGDRTNPERKKFNKRLTAEFSGSAIDLYDNVYHLKNFRTKDGIHYYKKQIRIYYKWMMKKIGRKVKVNPKTGKVKG